MYKKISMSNMILKYIINSLRAQRFPILPSKVYFSVMFKIFLGGNWGIWSAWASCSATCGGGTQTRSRVCDSPAPLYGGSDCVGSGVESQICNNVQCPVSKYTKASLIMKFYENVLLPKMT
jgi:hypothetical protein